VAPGSRMPTVKNVGEPCAGEPHARIDGGREETSVSRRRRATLGASRLPGHPRVAEPSRRSSLPRIPGGDRGMPVWVDGAG
jgi:hypothetical protein